MSFLSNLRQFVGIESNAPARQDREGGGRSSSIADQQDISQTQSSDSTADSQQRGTAARAQQDSSLSDRLFDETAQERAQRSRPDAQARGPGPGEELSAPPSRGERGRDELRGGSGQSPNISLEDETPDESSTRRPTDPGEDDKGATESTDSAGEPADRDPDIEAGNVPLANPLSVFASHSAIISLFVLTKEELANPDAYRQSEPEFLIARTGGIGADGDNITPTIFEENLGIRVEYFLDDLEVESILAQTANTRQTNATIVRFTLKEPYSMGMFLKALQFTVSRADPQRTSYIDPPYLLKIDFKGFNDQGEYIGLPRTSRYIPIKLTRIEFNVSAGGSEYQVEAIAWNDQAYADEIQTITDNLSLSGSSIQEFLTSGLQGRRQDTPRQGLAGFLEEREQNLASPNNEEQEPFKETPDQFIIAFPERQSNRQTNNRSQQDQGAVTADNRPEITVNSGGSEEAIVDELESFNNKIGESRIVVERNSAGVRDDGNLNEEGDLQLQRVTVSNDGRLLQFPAGMRIQDIIEEVVLLSEYAKDLAEKEPDSLGYKDWFRIETRVYEQLTEPDKITGKTPKVYVYSIVPYKVESHRFLGPDQSLGDSSIEQLKRLAPKKYEYIYSGANDDIISFDLQFNTAFFQGLQEDLGQKSQKIQEQGRGDLGLDDQILSLVRSAREVEEQETVNLPQATVQRERGTGVNTGQQGGSAGTGDTDERTAIARNFNEIIVNGLDLITLNIEIWGDPFFIADSGIGNYNAPGTGNPYVTSDNTLDYQYFEPICLLEFKTPIDYGQDGQMIFPENQGEPVAEFSGVYRILTVRNRISSNRFTQEMQMVRLRNQELQERSANTGPGFTVTNPGAPGGDAGVRS